MTSKFISAADLMARVLGADGYRFAVTAHPISSATGLALSNQACQAVRDSVDILIAN